MQANSDSGGRKNIPLPTVLVIVGVVLAVAAGAVFTMLNRPEEPKIYKGVEIPAGAARGGSR